MAEKAKVRHFFLLVLGLIVVLHPAGVSAEVENAEEQKLVPRAALAMTGEPKYGNNFTHFDYANPDAPKQGTLKLGATGTFDSLNPFIVRGQPALGLNTGYLSLVYESLMARSADEPFSLYGLIAETVEVPADRSLIVFNLNPKARWSDGAPVTADDVLFSFRTLRDKGRPNHRTYYKKVLKAEKVSPLRVKFTFRPAPDGSMDREMPLIMGLMPILPQHDWTGRPFDRTTIRIPIGSGPYRIESVVPGRSIVYARNADYWGRDLSVERGLHNFDHIRVDYYRDDAIALQAFKAGQFDVRMENNAAIWATAYDVPAVHDGGIILDSIEHSRTEPAEGFVFNTRRPLFHDKVLRLALARAFDSGWIARNLYHGKVRRTASYFPNSDLAAHGMPEGKERAILNQYRSRLPPDIFTAPAAPPETDGHAASLRANLLAAAAALKDANYVLRDGLLYAPDATTPVAFEIVLHNPAEEKIALTWALALRQLGITARVHTVDSAQYQARLAAFQFDVTVARWVNSLSPGNEQMVFWGSAAADQKGSRNYAGVKDPVVDALASAIPAARTREELVAATRALDRVLMAGCYMVPFFHAGADHVAYWTRVRPPEAASPYGLVMESWWSEDNNERGPERAP